MINAANTAKRTVAKYVPILSDFPGLSPPKYLIKKIPISDAIRPADERRIGRITKSGLTPAAAKTVVPNIIAATIEAT